MNPRTLAIVGTLAAVGVAAAFIVSRPEYTPAAVSAKPPEELFPELSARGNDVTTITVQRSSGTTTLRNEGGTWKVVEKAGYPARLDTVRAVVVGLSQLRATEPKTSRPDQYAKLGVEDPAPAPADPKPPSPDAGPSRATLVTLKDAKDATLASVIVGNTRWEGQGLPQSVYVRKAGDARAWLASGRIDLPLDVTGFLDTSLADIRRDRVRNVRITQPGGETVTVSREKQADPFALQGVPEGKELKDPGVPESVATAMAGLAFQDVARLGDIDFAGASPEGAVKPGPAAELRTFDGLIVTVAAVNKEGRAWWRLSAAVDEAVAAQAPLAQAAADGEKPAAPAVGTVEALRKEAADLNARWSGYAFAPQDWKARSLNQTPAELFRDAAPPGQGGPPSPADPPAPPVRPGG